MPTPLFVAIMFTGALCLIGFVLSGAGSPDRSDQAPPHLPGHDHLPEDDPRRRS